MSRITTEYTYTDGYYHCNRCDAPHEGETLAVECYGSHPPPQRHQREVKLFVQTVETYIIPASQAGSDDEAIEAAKRRFENGEPADLPNYGEARIVDTDVEALREVPNA